MAWFWLFVAGLFEIAWVVALKYSEGFSKLWPSVIFGVTAWISFTLLSQAIKSLPMGTSYAVWTGIGAVGVAIIGIVWFGESASPLRVFCIGLIVAGIVGLKFTASTSGVV
ncbi:quaternary ammonium compound efflux SMR transporter SugE [Congregibacter sp.]|jgi:quaternary ammonium compound-resistance protein SugE|uniref:quaternary ammonium compound efflux SMR transporter SugE n=1 Tax=Congregibacter sp. TaxID=2744308 RepID=UPI0039E2EE12